MVFHYILTILISAVVSACVYYAFRGYLRGVYLDKWGEDFLTLDKKIRQLEGHQEVDKQSLLAAYQDLREMMLTKFNRYAQQEYQQRRKSKEEEEADEVDQQIADLLAQKNKQQPGLFEGEQPQPKLVRRN